MNNKLEEIVKRNKCTSYEIELLYNKTHNYKLIEELIKARNITMLPLYDYLFVLDRRVV